MSEDAADSSWMDERDPDPELQVGLTCHVELDIAQDGVYRDLLAKAATALRATAAALEAGKFEGGFHPVKTLSGEEIGQVYIDYYGTM